MWSCVFLSALLHFIWNTYPKVFYFLGCTRTLFVSFDLLAALIRLVQKYVRQWHFVPYFRPVSPCDIHMKKPKSVQLLWDRFIYLFLFLKKSQCHFFLFSAWLEGVGQGKYAGTNLNPWDSHALGVLKKINREESFQVFSTYRNDSKWQHSSFLPHKLGCWVSISSGWRTTLKPSWRISFFSQWNSKIRAWQGNHRAHGAKLEGSAA